MTMKPSIRLPTESLLQSFGSNRVPENNLPRLRREEGINCHESVTRGARDPLHLEIPRNPVPFEFAIERGFPYAEQSRRGLSITARLAYRLQDGPALHFFKRKCFPVICKSMSCWKGNL